jgi:hypothetical protein
MDQFDPNNMAQDVDQAATGKADSMIDDVAGKVPGGDQFSQQAKGAADQAIQGGVQEGEQAIEGQAKGALDNLPGGLGEHLGGLSDSGASGSNQ